MSKDALDRGKIMTNNIFSTILKLLSLVTIYISMNVNAYQLSNEVPDPLTAWKPTGFTGQVVNPISGQAPESWSAAKQAGLPSYYIDIGDPLATNSNNPFGSPGKPRKTIPEITYDAGSYIEIHGGPYNGGGQIIFTANGTPDKPVWFRGSASNDRAIISGETIVKGQYVILENLEYNTPRKTISLRTHNGSMLHHAVIRNSVFKGDGQAMGSGSVIAIYGGSSTQRFHDFIIYNNEISYFGKDYINSDLENDPAPENDYHGILSNLNTDRVWILSNKIHNMGGDSVQVGIASTNNVNRVSHIYIADNDFYSNLENGVDIKEADNVIIFGNKIWDWKEHKGNSSTGVAVVIHNTANQIWVINNEISDAAMGVVTTGGSTNTWLVNNVIKNIKHSNWNTTWNAGLYESGGAIHFRGGSSGGAINNTIINYDKGIEISTGTYNFINNILFNRNVANGGDITAESTQANPTTSNNLIFSEGKKVNLPNVNCRSCRFTSPKFSDTTLVNYNTDIDGGGVGYGMPITTFTDIFKQVFSLDITSDFYGLARIKGGIDIGAVENQLSMAENSTTENLPTPAEIDKIEIRN